MKRRGFLGFLGGAAVAGPGMAKAAAAQGMEAMSLGNSTGLLSAVGYAGEAIASNDPYPGALHPSDPKHWVQRQLAEFMGRTAEELLEQRLNTQVHALDPDLAVNRSFSLATKVRMQRDRNFEANRASHKRSILNDIKQALKNWDNREDADLF